MQIEEANYSIAEIVDWYKNKNLVVNSEYQRGGGLWPVAAKSYFIDTILRDFPFPKVYFHEIIDRRTRRPLREIVDGQQRISTIVEFAEGGFALGKNAREFAGQHFDGLPEDLQDHFLAYAVSVDVIRNAGRVEILQMFRRMNAFTLPLNEAEKRHSEFFGEFKDWVNVALDKFGSILVDWKILSSRQVVRMNDAEFMADLALAVEDGVVSTSAAKLRDLYKRYDDLFASRDTVEANVFGALECVIDNFSEIQGTHATKPHIFHSLLCALILNRDGLPNCEDTVKLAPIGRYFIDRDRALITIKRLVAAHEESDLSTYAEYVKAASEGGNRATQRAIRIRWFCHALRGEVL